MVLQQPGDYPVFIHGNNSTIEGVIFAGVGVRTVRLHLVCAAWVVGNDVVDHRLHHGAPLAALGGAKTAAIATIVVTGTTVGRRGGSGLHKGGGNCRGSSDRNKT